MSQMILGLALAAPILATTASHGATKYVKPGGGGLGNGSSWVNAYSNPEQALSTAAADDVIWVAAGTYLPTQEFVGGQSQSKTFSIPRRVKMYGGFAGSETSLAQRNPLVNLTYLSGDLDTDATLDADNAWHVVRIQSPGGGESEIDDRTQLDGFIITLGYADGGGTYDSFGGGILVVNAKPVIQNCVFVKNHAATGGGGAHIDGPPTYVETIPPDPPPNPEAQPQFRCCRFLGNTAVGDGGGASILDGHGTFICCEFSGNDADSEGGGIWINTDAGAAGVPSKATTISCSFTNNSGTGRSVYNGNDLTVTNTIMWDTGSPADHIVEHSHASVNTTITDCNIEGDSSTLNSDPLFANPRGVDSTAGTVDDNLRLPCSSPSVDAADDTYLPDDTYDADDDSTTAEPTPTATRLNRIENSDSDHGANETIPDNCPEDSNGDHCVNVTDLLAVIGQWGNCSSCSADVSPGCSGDGVVNVTDLLAVIGEGARVQAIRAIPARRTTPTTAKANAAT